MCHNWFLSGVPGITPPNASLFVITASKMLCIITDYQLFTVSLRESERERDGKLCINFISRNT